MEMKTVQPGISRPEFEKIKKQTEHYELDADGILLDIKQHPRRKDPASRRVVVPRALVKDILHAYHDHKLAGHPGIDRTLDHIQM